MQSIANTEHDAWWSAGEAPRKPKVAIIGLGYVGLPLALSFVEGGAEVVGLDVDTRKVDALLEGRSYLGTLDDDPVRAAMATGRLRPTSSAAAVAGADAFILCVPTPLTRQREPDMRFIHAAIRSISRYVEAGALVCLESTTYPGTTREVVAELIAKRTGLRPGADFCVAFSPEREDPGNAHFGTRTIPKLVGGMTARCTRRALSLYRVGIDNVVPVSSPEIAEMAKIFENVFRMVNIGLVNELKVACQRFSEGGVDIDVHEVIDAAATKPFGYMRFFPGPGLGGHCIPIDPYYLSWRAREFDAKTRLLEIAGEINAEMPRYVVERLVSGLSRQQKALHGSRLLVVGVAYKDDIDDVRESPALKIIRLLREGGAEVRYHDPHVESLSVEGEAVPALAELDADALAGFDAVLLTAHHRRVDYGPVLEHAPLIVDTRNVVGRDTVDPERLVKA
ncbi:UDP-glucose 6-dehydrogenase [Plesiocystis pacifica SIR-1]|uniref:UDP-glucose 6-dehydrogenase n=1 Tax=Plesiocystis pacifica SIR-1 TaxID=391625 RepID=A6G1H9_9BACT|nr:nucleotide sugar dehydrogenase [Plesiocystis pacifica]EDM80243.1 UDP-glucose 6-dehydrogenase [Plesiocystis pacifica SIR-1]